MASCKKRTEENAITTQTKLNMRKSDKNNWLRYVGAILILIGVISIFPENDTLLHTTLQITFVVGCVIFIIGGRLPKKNGGSSSKIMNCSAVGFMLLLSISFSNNLSAQKHYTTSIE